MNSNLKTLIIEFCIVLLGGAEVINLVSCVVSVPLDKAAIYILIFFIAEIAVFIVLLTITVKRKKLNPFRFFSYEKAFQLPVLFAFLLCIFQMVFHFFLSKPYINLDITGETVNTFLSTNSIHTVNPMTGFEYTEGIPTRLKVLALPLLYSSICSITKCSSYIVVYKLVPSVVCLLAYVVIMLYGDLFFEQDRKKKGFFILICALCLQFASLGPIAPGRLLFLQAYTGEAIRTMIILPFLIISLLKKRYFDIILCLLAEVTLCWTLYGFGYGVIIVIVYYVIVMITNIIKRRNQHE